MLALVAALLAASPEVEVSRALKGADGFSPAQFSSAMKAIEAVGPAGVPALAQQRGALRTPNELWTVCEALTRVPGEAALPAIEKRLGHESWLVRGSCMRAFGAALVKGGRTPERMKRIRAIVNGDDCALGMAAAETIGPLEDPVLRADFEGLLERPGCAREVAVFGLRSATKDTAAISARMLAFLQDP